MPQFTPSQKQLTDFNNGNKFVNHVDSPSADDFNNVIESQLYTQGLAKNTPDTSEANNVGTPSVTVTTSSDGSARFKFSNLKGVGISNIIPNGTDQSGNNIYVIQLTDGSSYNFTSPKGSQGIQGEQGIGIANIIPNGQDSTGSNIYTVLLTNGTSYNFTAPKGAQGIQGNTGVGISTITPNGTDINGGNIYRITLTDGSYYDFTAPKGNQGESGVTGVTSGTTSENNGYTVTPLTFQFENGNSQTADVKVKNGIDGKNGTNGIDGINGITPNIQIGQVNTGEAGAEAAASITGTPENPLLNLTIPQGQQGIQGVPGQNGAPGANGTTYTPTVDSAGNLSWTNDGGLSNPATVNIKGPKGDAGQSTIVKTAAEWAADNTVLEAGQFGYDSTNKITKIGDGTTAWNTLPSFVTTDLSFAKSSWAQIAALSESGAAKTYFSVGDEKTIELTTGEEITLVILGFNHDDLTGGGKAGMSIGMKNLLATTYRMNTSSTNAGGWDESEMRTSTMATLLSQLPSDLQSVIKQVNKKATAGSQSESITTSADKLWLLAMSEIFSATSIENSSTWIIANNADTYNAEGTQYKYYENLIGDNNGGTATNSLLIKKLSNGSGSANPWWLRSPRTNINNNFWYIRSSGDVNNSNANITYGVSFGFCI